MRRSILLALAAAALVAAPQAWAQEQHPDKQDHAQGGHGQQHGAAPQGQRGGQHPGPGGQPGGQRGGPMQGQQRFGGGPALRGGPAPGHGQVDARFDRRADPGHWAQARGGWRGANAGWHSAAIWGRGAGWWRGRPEFRGYAGVRVGFWFIPGIGYWQVPPAYWGHHWGYGQYVPAAFWNYQVADYWNYGLPSPPPGCAWVWVGDGGVALIDLTDGYVMDIQYGIY